PCAAAGSAMSTIDWPPAGWTRRGRAYKQPTSAQPTGATASSSSPTAPPPPPTASSNTPQPVLLPTPQARDGDGRGPMNPTARRANGHSVGLDDAVSVLLH